MKKLPLLAIALAFLLPLSSTIRSGEESACYECKYDCVEDCMTCEDYDKCLSDCPGVCDIR